MHARHVSWRLLHHLPDQAGKLHWHGTTEPHCNVQESADHRHDFLQAVVNSLTFWDFLPILHLALLPALRLLWYFWITDGEHLCAFPYGLGHYYKALTAFLLYCLGFLPQVCSQAGWGLLAFLSIPTYVLSIRTPTLPHGC